LRSKTKEEGQDTETPCAAKWHAGADGWIKRCENFTPASNRKCKLMDEYLTHYLGSTNRNMFKHWPIQFSSVQFSS